MAFLRRSEKDEVSLAFLQIYAPGMSDPTARLEPLDLTREERRAFMRDLFPAFPTRRVARNSELKFARCTYITKDESYWSPLYAECKRLSHAFSKPLNATAAI